MMRLEVDVEVNFLALLQPPRRWKALGFHDWRPFWRCVRKKSLGVWCLYSVYVTALLGSLSQGE